MTSFIFVDFEGPKKDIMQKNIFYRHLGSKICSVLNDFKSKMYNNLIQMYGKVLCVCVGGGGAFGSHHVGYSVSGLFISQ